MLRAEIRRLANAPTLKMEGMLARDGRKGNSGRERVTLATEQRRSPRTPQILMCDQEQS